MTEDATAAISRREALRILIALALAPGALHGCWHNGDAADALRRLEKRAGGRLGTCVLNTGNNRHIGHRLNERFGLCSTFKALLAAIVLQQAERGELPLDRFVAFDEADMVPYAPVTSKNLERGGMSVVELAAAAQQTSDNVAANLLLELIGGPRAFTSLLRASGDELTRLDRYEPELNFVPAAETRDTTTPLAMAESLQRFVIGKLLSAASRKTLSRWMQETVTGKKRLRAGFPPDWPVGNKTGTAYAPDMANKTNDVAVVWPPHKPPHVITCYYEADGSYGSVRDIDQAVVADVARLATDWIHHART